MEQIILLAHQLKELSEQRESAAQILQMQELAEEILCLIGTGEAVPA